VRWDWAVICVAGTSMSGWGGGCYSSSATVPPYASAKRPTAVTSAGNGADSQVAAATSAASPFSNIALRKAWQPAEEPRAWKYVVLHHTATDRGSVESIHEAHLAKEWLGIGYHFVIGNGEGMPDGRVEPTFRWTRQLHGAHAGVKDYNELGIGVCLVGNFEEHPPTAEQLNSLKSLVASLTGEYRIPATRVVPHRDLKATACPGKFFPLDDVTLAASGGRRPPVDATAANDFRRRFDQDVVVRIFTFPGEVDRTGGSRPPLALAGSAERRTR
jgi:N-acetyl-anhydromuramyl-L-alanine amidase AmpD